MILPFVVAVTLAQVPPPEPLWEAIAHADAVVRVTVVRVEGSRAHVRVDRLFAGKVPDAFTVPKDDQVGCFPMQAFFPGQRKILALREMRGWLRTQLPLLTDAEAAPFIEAGARASAWVVGGPAVTIATGEQSRVDALVELALAAQKNGQPAGDAWALSLLHLPSTHWLGFDWFDGSGQPIPDVARQDVARDLLSRQIHTWLLPRVLRWVAPLRDEGLTRAALDIVRRDLPQVPPDFMIERAIAAIAERVDPRLVGFGLDHATGERGRARARAWLDAIEAASSRERPVSRAE